MHSIPLDCRRLDEAGFRRGGSVTKQGDTGDESFTIKSGKDTAHIKPDTGKSKQVD